MKEDASIPVVEALPAPEDRPLSLRRDGPLLRLTASLFFLQLGGAMTAVALPLWVIEKYGLGLDSGLALGISLLPTVVLGPFVGALVDYGDKRLVAIVAAAAEAIVVALIPATHSLWQIEVLALALGFLTMLGLPARMALRPLVMEPGTEVAGNSLIVAAERTTLMLGPLIAGPIIAIAGLSWVFFAEAVAVGAAGFLILRLPLPAPAAPPGPAAGAELAPQPPLRSLLRSPREMAAQVVMPLVRMVARDRMLAALTLTSFTYVTAVAAGRILLTVLAASHFQEIPGLLGYLLAAMGAGAVVGALAAGRFVARHQGRLYLVGNLAEACCWIALPFVPYAWAALAVVLFAGLFESLATVVYFAEAQARLKDNLIGRYYASLIPLTSAFSMLGAVLGAPLLEHGGVDLGGGVIAALIAVPVLLLCRTFLREPGANRSTPITVAVQGG
jgi:MFS family permease